MLEVPLSGQYRIVKVRNVRYLFGAGSDVQGGLREMRTLYISVRPSPPLPPLVSYAAHRRNPKAQLKRTCDAGTCEPRSPVRKHRRISSDKRFHLFQLLFDRLRYILETRTLVRVLLAVLIETFLSSPITRVSAWPYIFNSSYVCMDLSVLSPPHISTKHMQLLKTAHYFQERHCVL
jgi:hypothetical protein